MILPGVSAPPSASASPAMTPVAQTLPTLPDQATDPIGYLQGISAQIQALAAQLPTNGG